MTNTTTYGAAKLSKPMARELFLATIGGGTCATSSSQNQRTMEALCKRGLVDYVTKTGDMALYVVSERGLEQAVELEPIAETELLINA